MDTNVSEKHPASIFSSVSNCKYILKVEAVLSFEALVYHNPYDWLFVVLVFSDQFPYYALKWAAIISHLFLHIVRDNFSFYFDEI
jgi:hypothetical protein